MSKIVFLYSPPSQPFVSNPNSLITKASPRKSFRIDSLDKGYNTFEELAGPVSWGWIKLVTRDKP